MNVLIFSLAALLTLGCGREENSSSEVLKLSSEKVEAVSGTVRVTVSVDGAWTLSLRDSQGNNPSWASIHLFGEAHCWDISADGKDCIIVLDYDANDGQDERKCALSLVSGGTKKTAEFVQSGVGGSSDTTYPSAISADPVPSWMELPAVTQRDGCYFVIPYSKGGYSSRNYSYYWDLDSKVALWVAYPLCASYLRSENGTTCGRSDAWAMDKRLPKEAQPSLVKRSYEDENGNWSGYARGHQLPSADRQAVLNQNKETFYGVNMTPQIGSFNSGVWSELEGLVRNYSELFDTLYVVTGCVVDGSDTYVYDERKGDQRVTIRVPKGYFKALLGYAGASASRRQKYSSLSSSGYYAGVAYYFEDQMTCGKPLSQYRITIDELEKKTGFDFFVNLPDSFEASVENNINSCWK